ncbi:MAG: response regulator [Bacteroidales bacterium]|nr:response regulator [Bacteroidales bacterium]MCF8455106.1 response regulator [Bacteroidales bacterium]
MLNPVDFYYFWQSLGAIRYILLLLVFSINLSYGQVVDVSDFYSNNEFFFPKFEHLGEDEGFPVNRISCVAQDNLGYLWVGSMENGLFRYDGHQFESFELDHTNPFSLPGNDVYFIHEDSRKILWIGTNKALCYFLPEKHQFIKMKIDSPDDAKGLIFTSIFENEIGDLFIGTNKGIYLLSNIARSDLLVQEQPVLNPDSMGIELHRIEINVNSSINSVLEVKDLAVDKEGRLWILHERVLGLYTTIHSFQEAISGNQYPIHGYYQQIAELKLANKLCLDESGILRTSYEDEIIKINTNSPKITVERLGIKSNLAQIDDFHSMDKPRKIFWVGHHMIDIHILDDARNKFYPICFESSDENSLFDKGVSCFLRTSSNVIFIGTVWGGLFKFNPYSFQSNYHPNLQSIHLNQPNNLRYTYEDSRGLIWMIARDVDCCDKNSGQVLATYGDTFFDHEWHYKNKLIEDKNGRMWIGLEGGGLGYFDVRFDSRKNRKEVKTTPLHRILNNSHVSALYEDKDGNIWVGAFYNSRSSVGKNTSLFKVSGDGKILSEYVIASWPYGSEERMSHFINQIVVDTNGFAWLATGFGLGKFDLQNANMELFQYPEQDSLLTHGYRFLTLLPDPNKSDSILWIGTAGGGLLSFNNTNNSFHSYHEVVAKHINSMLTDDAGRICLGTTEGIIQITLNKNGGEISRVKKYEKSDGLITNDYSFYYGHNAVKTKNGRLIFTGPKGFQVINPEQIKSDPYIPPVYLSEFFLNYKPADYLIPGSPLEKPIYLTENINLPYEQNTLGFELNALDFNSPNHLNYAFLLENYDNDWIYTGNKNVIHYTKLPSGKYKLKYKLANKDGLWGEATEGLQLLILRPWWFGNWAWMVYLLLLSAVVIFWVKVFQYRQKMNMHIELNKMEANKLKELDAMKSKFFANISHEFRTPLTLIMNPVEVILDNTSDTLIRRNLQLIKKNANHLLQYISEILDLSKLEANRLSLHVRKVDLNEVVRNLVASFESWAHKKQIHIKLKSPAGMLFFFLDPEKINTILSNLFSNAIKYTPENGQINIDISICKGGCVDHCTLKVGCLIISVTNTGPGIPQENLPYIFDRYYRVEKDMNKSEYGTGLGLTLVKELVQLHNGTINVKSVEGEFTNFTLRFPLIEPPFESKENTRVFTFDTKRGNIQLDEWEEVQVSENIDLSQDKEKKIVLIIEDNRDMRSILKSALKSTYKLIEAEDGDLGEKLAIETIPDIIISDLMMPKKNGYEVARSLKSNEMTSHIPIILLTARADISDKIAGLETGADDYLIKPFYEKELKVRVRNLMEQRKKLKNKYSRLNILKLDNLPEKSIDQAFLEKVTRLALEHISDENFDVQTLLDNLTMSRTQLHRKLKALTNQSATEFIRSIRLQKASEMLKGKTGTVAEIAYQVGFQSLPYFNKVFKEYYGHTPSEHIEEVGE